MTELKTDTQKIGNLYDKKEIKRLKKLGLNDREIRNLRSQQTSGGKQKNEVPVRVVVNTKNNTA